MAKALKVEAPKPSFAVFGLADDGKPRGARFEATEANVIEAVVASLGLHMHQVNEGDLKVIADKLPAGRVYARGKAFIPNIKRDLLDKLHAAVGVNSAPSAVAAAAKQPAAMPNLSPALLLQSGLPTKFDEIAAGHLVLVHESLEEGWWEAICVDRDKDMLTLRYRDYPKVPPFKEHVSCVAIMHPSTT